MGIIRPGRPAEPLLQFWILTKLPRSFVTMQRNNSYYGRSVVGDVLNPTNGYRGSLERRGIQPKNHMKENRIALKYSQVKNREAKDMEKAQKPRLYKLEQFQNVESRLMNTTTASRLNTQRSTGQGRSRTPPSDEFVYDDDENDNSNLEDSGVFAQASTSSNAILKRGAGQARREALAEQNRQAREVIKEQFENARYVANRPSTPKKGATPKATELGVFAPRNQSNFISKNKTEADNMVVIDKKSARQKQFEKNAHHDSFGKVPEYLKEYKAKAEIEEAEKRKRMPDPSCPKGMKLMPEEERKHTLSVLLASKEEAMKQLSQMPFLLETPSSRKKHSDLEDKLKEIENAIALFSRTKVYIAMDS